MSADFSAIPKGLYLCRAFYERTGSNGLTIGLKVSDAPWHDQPAAPVWSEEHSGALYPEFWAWAKQSLPLYEYPNPIKSSS